MIEQFFDGPARIQSLRAGQDGQFLEGFAKELFQERYAEITARRHLRAAEHFLFWISQEGIPVSSLTIIFIEPFDHHLDQCQCHVSATVTAWIC